MKALRYFLLFAVIFFTGNHSFAQMTPDPAAWKVEVKKKSATAYQLIFHLSLKAGWHVYAKAKGMDESLIVPSFSFDKSSGVTINGEATQQGILVSKNIEGFGPVSMYSDKVIYTQNITAKKGAKITGTYTYQTCNDNMCLPPKTKNFSVVIKN